MMVDADLARRRMGDGGRVAVPGTPAG
jgi:hypothetical protein